MNTRMKLTLIYLFGLLAIASALASHKFDVDKDGSVLYESPNVHFKMFNNGSSYLQTKDQEHSAKIETNTVDNQVVLSNSTMKTVVNMTKEDIEAMVKPLKVLAAKIALMHKRDTLSDFWRSVKITDDNVRFGDVWCGLDISVKTNGQAYVVNTSNVLVQTTPASIGVRKLNGKIESMDISKMRETARVLSDALAKEAKYWISINKSS